MRINSFTATKVHEYLSIDIDFNDDLSIITGVNGAGKTTAIMLLQAILCPNLKDLLTIPFEKIVLSINHHGADSVIMVQNIEGMIRITINSISTPFELPKSSEDLDYLNYKQNKDGVELNEYLLRNASNHPVIEFIKSLPSPIFIGLERRTDEIQSEREDLILERRMLLNKSRHEFSEYKRQFKGTLGVSLFETEFLVQSIYKRLKSIEDGYTSAIQKELLLSSFEYITFDPRKDTNITLQEKRNLLLRRQEIQDALKKIGYDNNSFQEKLNMFFQKLEKLIDSLDQDGESKGGISIEWLTNKSQIDKLTKLVELIDDYNSKINNAFKPINRFIEILNSFLSDTGKKIFIDKVGHLLVKRPFGKDVSIDALSSGERQIVILFANVMFNKYTAENVENILIIDEPELSLHIKWQEKFIDTLLISSNKTQFILATHSPDIVGDYKSKGVKINKFRGNVQ